MGSGPENPQKPFALTPEENKLIEELQKEAFWQRCVPMTFGTTVGVATLIKMGKLKGHPKYGALPKMLGFSAIAYFAGKLSYIPVMQQQILQRLPNSNLAASIRKAQNLPAPAEESPHKVPDLPPRRKSDDYQPQEGFDDRFRPSLDREVEEDSPLAEEKKKSITHEELRKRNREQYEESRKNSAKSQPDYKETPWMPQKPFPPPNPDMFQEPNKEPEVPERKEPPTRKKRTNIWGDEIE